MKPSPSQRADEQSVRRPERDGVIVTRRDVDDAARLRRLLELLSDVLDSPDTPDDDDGR